MRRFVALAALVVLTACDGGTDSATPETTSGSPPPVASASSPPPSTSTNPPATPNETLSTEVVPGPPALTVLGVDGTNRWEAPPTAGFVAGQQVAVQDGVVVGISFCDGPVDVKAWDLDDGSPLWSAAVPNSLGGGATLALSAGVALVSTSGGLIALDSHTGDQRWQAEQMLWGASGDTVLTSGLGGPPTSATSLAGLDASTGGERWKTAIAAGGYVAGLTADADRAYATVYGADGLQQVAAFTLVDGAEAWRVPLGAGSDRFSVQPTVGAAAGAPTDIPDVATAAVDAVTGEERWRVSGYGLPQQGPGSTFALDGNLYVQRYDGSAALAALDPATGQVRWLVSPADLGGSTATTVSAVDGGFLVGIDDELVLLDAADGSERWRRPPAGVFLGAGEGAVAFGSECPNLGD